jgi:hypothetical protein
VQLGAVYCALGTVYWALGTVQCSHGLNMRVKVSAGRGPTLDRPNDAFIEVPIRGQRRTAVPELPLEVAVTASAAAGVLTRPFHNSQIAPSTASGSSKI